ncbi:hypothetical protein Tco_0057706 [Tanacetum coccineum]
MTFHPLYALQVSSLAFSSSSLPLSLHTPPIRDGMCERGGVGRVRPTMVFGVIGVKRFFTYRYRMGKNGVAGEGVLLGEGYKDVWGVCGYGEVKCGGRREKYEFDGGDGDKWGGMGVRSWFWIEDGGGGGWGEGRVVSSGFSGCFELTLAVELRGLGKVVDLRDVGVYCCEWGGVGFWGRGMVWGGFGDGGYTIDDEDRVG